jgi:hypothetical protein
MSTPSIEAVRGWRGRVMVDRDSNKIGEVVDIYLDNETDRPEWAVVRTGLFGLRSTFVPLAEAREVGDELQVPHQKLQVKQAPNIEPDGQLSAAEEAELFRHYGLDYDSVTLDSGAPTGQTLAEPAAQTNKPGSTDQAGATATGVPEPASTATGGLADTGLDAEPGTPTPKTGSPGLAREPDTAGWRTPAWTESPTPGLSSPSRAGAMPATACRPPAAASRLNLPGKTGCPWVRGRAGHSCTRRQDGQRVALEPVVDSPGRCGCVGIWSPRW